ncbi:unnamed protein product [Protopolystoma xenopodis]|uniref:Uncharacterized protein n=1 Tax=Protopolystoma xenopodis TaxID=117903 RepID=A0A3S5FGV0_9PLAT|nr:unnamed protein product [Protopolystoma xenopodis]
MRSSQLPIIITGSYAISCSHFVDSAFAQVERVSLKMAAFTDDRSWRPSRRHRHDGHCSSPQSTECGPLIA